MVQSAASSPEVALFAQPFPRHGAASALRERVILHLRRSGRAPGEPFLNDAELVAESGLSRSTVRRALDGLRRDGWVSREAGRGTFVGPRLARLGNMDQGEAPAAGRAVRLGVVLFDIAALAGDWITPHVLAGIDDAADGAGVKVEMIGACEADAEAILRRLERDRPDALASLAANPRDALFLRDAARLGIPSLVVGTAHQYLGLPAVVEDNDQGARLAVRRLLDAGHERVGLVLNRWPAGWVFERQEAFERAMLDGGLDADAPGTCWVGAADHPGLGDPRHSHRNATRIGLGLGVPGPFDDAAERVAAWLDRHRPTAVVAGSYAAAQILGGATRALGWAIPRDLSVVGFDPHPQAAEWLGVRPTLVRLPLREMGRRIAGLARGLADGADPSRIGRVRVPFAFEAGDSVAAPPS